MQESLIQYNLFINEVDALCRRLYKIHSKHLLCRKGCFSCCTDISVLAVEAYAILMGFPSMIPENKNSEAEEENLSDFSGSNTSKQNLCAFLDQDGACRIYPFRPLICRTHGLPLLYLMEEYDTDGERVQAAVPQWQLFYCDLNFQGITEDHWEKVFTPEDVLDMEEWNRRLVEINEKFRGSIDGSSYLAAVRQGKYGKTARKELYETGRVPLSSLAWLLL